MSWRDTTGSERWTHNGGGVKAATHSARRTASIMVLGVGSFAHSTASILADDGAAVSTYLTRDYGHFAPSLAGATWDGNQYPNPCRILKTQRFDLMVPMSIDWAQAPWKKELLASPTPIFCPTGEGMRIERERDFARSLCERFGIPFPDSYVAANRLQAEEILRKHPAPYVIKNPLCSPKSPVHTILCETMEDTRSWLKHINYAEGVFLQEYMGRAEAGHIALVSAGEVYPLVTNQEYKRAFTGHMGVVPGAPMGGLVEQDLGDKYGLARQLLRPLRPWFRAVNYHGPIQVTAAKHGGRWKVLEYNIRIGVTSGAMLLRMLANPTETLLRTARNQKVQPRFKRGMRFGCSITLAGYGYPYVQLAGPRLPVEVRGKIDKGCDLWWNEVERTEEGHLVTTGHRICDVIAFAPTRPAAIKKAAANIVKIRSLGSYYRTDIGQSLWPPGRI
jgi:phosphoribosylamine-glycine ligase